MVKHVWHIQEEKRCFIKGMFDDLSIAQVLAGALAAVTSMLLASQIGIYGSVIGVGVGSVISAVASQLYKKFLSASADKIREVSGYGEGDAEDAARDGARSSAETTVLSAVGSTALSQETVVMAPVGKRQSSCADSQGCSSHADANYYRDGRRVRAQAARRRKERTKQRVLVVSVVSALVAVVLSAAAITVITQGEGMGEKPQHFVSAIQDAGGSDAQMLGSSPSNTDQAQSREDGAVQTPTTSGDGAAGAPGAETDAGSSGEGSASGSSGSSGDAAVGGSGQNGSGGSGDGASSDSGGESGQTGAGADVSGGSQDGTNASGGTGTSE